MAFLTGKELDQAVEANKHILTDYFDENYAISLEKNVLLYVDKYYFRCEYIGFEDYPERNDPKRPLIFISNHSGMAFPWDGMMFSSGILRMHRNDSKKVARPFAAPMLSQSTLMNPYLIPHFWKRAGAIDASTLNFEILMRQSDHNIMVYPEGVDGIGKGFNNKYKLQRFATSFVRMSIKYKTDIIPILTINGEYINPYVFSFDWLNNLTRKIGIPFIPVGPHMLLLLIFPWIFYFAFPAKLIFIACSRIKPYEMTDKSIDEISRKELEEISNKVRVQMQQDLDEAVEKHGKSPFQFRELFKRNFSNVGRIPFFSPGWPLLFAEHERAYKEAKGKKVNIKIRMMSIIKILFNNPSALWFFIPVIGWIPIAIKGYKGNQIKNKK